MILSASAFGAGEGDEDREFFSSVVIMSVIHFLATGSLKMAARQLLIKAKQPLTIADVVLNLVFSQPVEGEGRYNY